MIGFGRSFMRSRPRGETYAYPRDISREEALKLWIQAPRKTYVIEEDETILGTYYIKTNQARAGKPCVQLRLHGLTGGQGAGTSYRHVHPLPDK